MITLKYPFAEDAVRSLNVGDAVSITGMIHTGRDKFHKWFADGRPIGVDFRNGALYHCGPVVVKDGDGWRVNAAGPTTSVRENPYEPEFIRRSGVRLVIGKGGMDAATLDAMRECGCVYIQAVGGAAAVSAAAVRRVAGVDFLEEFGAAEACWHFEVEDFRGVVAMDSHGRSLFADVAEKSRMALRSLFKVVAMALAVNCTAAFADGALPATPSGVEFRDCPKCDKRIRIDLAEDKAYVNLSRLEGAAAADVAERAAKLLEFGRSASRGPKGNPLRPLMGWSSWNTFGVDISESIILETARAMATNGLAAAGYSYVNIDDGFFWGHGEDGRLRFHPERFPNGMKPVVDGIHALGLKAGIYSDAGADTCGSMHSGDGDSGGVGGGLFGHDAEDCKLHFNELGFDFIKVDYCGGRVLRLDEKRRYTEIAQAIRATGRSDVRLNICRWAFPGTWAAEIAESWRTTKDIRANWKSVKDIIEENLYLGAYASPGHYNDMDMLEVGQRVGSMKTVFGKHGDTGLTVTEETTHFGMWCMLSSPLLIGCDVRTIPADTMRLITNPYLLAVNQNDLGCQASVAWRDGDACILVKDADVRFGTSRYVALYNGSDEEHEFDVRSSALDLGGVIDAFDLVEMADVGCFEGSVAVRVAPHAAKFYRFDAERRLPRTVYEAEEAFLTEYQEIHNPENVGTAYPAKFAGASGGMVVRNLGGRPTNDLIWKEVKINSPGEYVIAFDCVSQDEGAFMLTVDGGVPLRIAVPGSGGKWAKVQVCLALEKGIHAVRLFGDVSPVPAIDRMTVQPVVAGTYRMRFKTQPVCEAVEMLESEMARMPVPAGIDKRKKPKWEYTDGLLLQAALAVAQRHPQIGEQAFAWAQDYIERMVTKDGAILGYRKEDCKLDSINTGKFAFDMYERAIARGDAAEARRLRRVLDEMHSQFAIQPRVAEGGFWHKRVYTRQMWLDGLYMGCPFYARYAAKFLDGAEREKVFCDISNQFAVVTRHTYDPATHLFRHGWDEAKAQVWADRTTGQSAHAWGRALGWFAAAIVDTIDYLPQEHPARAYLVALANDYFRELVRWQDPSGAWWQVADAPGRPGNYLESTSTALVGYAFVKAWNRGYVGPDVRDAGLRAYDALKRDFIRRNADGTVSLTRCCSVAGLSDDRDGSFEYYLREPVRDNDHKGTGPFMLLALEVEGLRTAGDAAAEP